MRSIRPFRSVPSVHHVDYGALWARGVRGIIFDLDNTLCRWRADALSEEADGLIRQLRGHGFRLAVVSNGRLSLRGQLLHQLETLQVPVVWPARKPLPRGFLWAVSLMGLPRNQVVMVGDQVFTDVVGARLAGLGYVLVSPLSFSEHPATMVVRWVERLVRRPP